MHPNYDADHADACGPARTTTSIKFSDRSPLTIGVRFRLTGPVSPVTGRNRINANLNSNSPVEMVLNGIPAGLIGLPVGLTGNRSNLNFFIFCLNSNARKVY